MSVAMTVKEQLTLQRANVGSRTFGSVEGCGGSTPPHLHDN